MKKGLVMSTLMQLKKSGTVRGPCIVTYIRIYSFMLRFLRAMDGSRIPPLDCALTSTLPTQGNDKKFWALSLEK